MARSKRAPALFEVIQPRQLQASSSRFPLPRWWRVGRSKSPNYPPVSQPEEKPAERDKIIKLVPQFDSPVDQQRAPASTPPQVDTPPLTPPLTTDDPGSGAASGTTGGASAGTGEKPPIVGMGAGRVQFSLNPVSLGVVFGAIVLIVFGAYQIGKGYSSLGPKKDDLAANTPGATDPGVLNNPGEEQPQGRKTDSGGSQTSRSGTRAGFTPPAKESGRESVSPVLHKPVAPAPPRKLESEPPAKAGSSQERSGGTVARTKGLNYLYIVRFRSENRDDAEHARKWLRDKGINATIEDGGSMLSLVSTDGFDMTDPSDKARCQQLQAKLKSLSPEYKLACKDRELWYDFAKPELRKQKD